MTFLRRVGVIGILSASWLVAVACDDSGDRKDGATAGGEGGEAGDGPSAGKSTVGGSANNPGNGGVGGASEGGVGASETGGTGTGGTGTGGTSTGGSAVDGGAGAGQVGGEGGGGAVLGVGGASAGAGGSGGASEGGAGGVPAAVVKSCGNECEVDDDCKIDASTSQKCDSGSHRCYDSTVTRCSTNDDCLGTMWTVTCDTDAECAGDGTESCVTLGSSGYCALLTVGDACDFGFGGPKDMPRHGATGVSNVCVAFDTCQEGTCKTSCADPIFDGFGCGAGDGDACNAETGRCECTAGSECSSTVCGAGSRCAECVVNEDCAGGLGATDVCVDGKCGCSSTDVCPDLTDAATPVCE